jgi:hypothetical protein
MYVESTFHAVSVGVAERSFAVEEFGTDAFDEELDPPSSKSGTVTPTWWTFVAVDISFRSM